MHPILLKYRKNHYFCSEAIIVSYCYARKIKLHHCLLRITNTISQTQMSPEVFIEKVKNLTELQIRFIERIIEECGESTSYDDFSKRLLAINKDISSSIPEIQQERLYNITAVLYYGMGEIENLEKQGQILSTPYNGVQPVHRRSMQGVGGGDGEPVAVSSLLPFG